MNEKHLSFAGLFLVALFSFFTYVWNYTNPPYLYWDENYHIASAQKYLEGVFFMEPHPPLGKLLIAAGEALFDANEEDDQFIGTDYAKELPAGFSFKGYRFFPVILAWLVAPLLYLIFLLITRKPIWAFLLSFLYIFDTALITHSRAAMLDSTMLFFCVSMIACSYLIYEYQNRKKLFLFFSILFGIAFAGAMSTKALALIMILLVPVLILALSDSQKIFNFQFSIFNLNWSRIIPFLTLATSSFLIVYISIWSIHFHIGKKVVDSLPDNGYYQASTEYKDLLSQEKIDLPLMMRDHLKFLTHYSKGVPELNLCKADENGSPFFYWPLGARSINYRWETPDGSIYQYITLQANPVIWWSAFLSVVIAFVLLLGSMLILGATKLQYRNELLIWSMFWASYMIAVSQIDRVMYLYHYFIPLLVSFILFAYVFLEIKQIGIIKLSDARKSWILLVFCFAAFASFQFFRPLAYYERIADEDFKKRMMFPLWDLRCVNCDQRRLIADPLE